jgi:CRP-like cAMP-binding protein
MEPPISPPMSPTNVEVDSAVPVIESPSESFDESIEDEEIKQIKTILKLAPDDRSADDVRLLMNFTSHIEFFRKLSDDNFPEAHLKCCQYMHYECKRAEQTVFDYGERGSTFYIILKGAVKVLVPSKFVGFDQVAVLKQGQSFGELALTKKQPRAAKVVCSDDTHFATITKKDFKAILGKLTEQMLNSRVSFLSELPVFSFWSKRALAKLSYFFKEIRFTRRQVVFRQGDQGNELYFIKEGEFQLNKLIKHTSEKKLHKPQVLQMNAQVALLARGEFFGDEDLLMERPWSMTCVCNSSQGVVLAIAKDNFFQRLSSSDVTSYLKSRNDTKNSGRTERLENFASLVTKGHLPISSRASPTTKHLPTPSSASPTTKRLPTPSRASPTTKRPADLRTTDRSKRWVSTDFESVTSGRLKFESLRSSPSSSPIKLTRTSTKASTCSLERLNLRTDVPISVLGLTQRLQTNKNHRNKVKALQLKPIVNIHVERLKTCSTQSSLNRLAGIHPFSAERSSPSLTASKFRQRDPVVTKIELNDEESEASRAIRRPARRIMSTRHSMFRVAN